MAEFVVRAFQSPRMLIGNRIEQSKLLYAAKVEGERSIWEVRFTKKHSSWVMAHMQDMGIEIVREQKVG